MRTNLITLAAAVLLSACAETTAPVPPGVFASVGADSVRVCPRNVASGLKCESQSELAYPPGPSAPAKNQAATVKCPAGIWGGSGSEIWGGSGSEIWGGGGSEIWGGAGSEIWGGAGSDLKNCVSGMPR